MRDLVDMPLSPAEAESPDPVRLEISRHENGLWKLEAFYRGGAVSFSWHRTRAEALKEAQAFA